MRVLVCGGRHYKEYEYLITQLDYFHSQKPFTELVHGGAKGADSLASKWAEERNIPQRAFMAKWKQFGKRAGYVRNMEMIQAEPDLVIAFPGGRGTDMMVKIAETYQVRVIDLRKEIAINE